MSAAQSALILPQQDRALLAELLQFAPPIVDCLLVLGERLCFLLLSQVQDSLLLLDFLEQVPDPALLALLVRNLLPVNLDLPVQPADLNLLL